MRPAARTLCYELARRALCGSPRRAHHRLWPRAKPASATRCRPCAAIALPRPLPIREATDLTAHVDFADLKRAGEALGLKAYGPMPQGEFLLKLGLGERRDRLLSGHARRSGSDPVGRIAAGRPHADGDPVQIAGADRAAGLPATAPSATALSSPSVPAMVTPDKMKVSAPRASRAIDGIAHGFFTRQGGVSTRHLCLAELRPGFPRRRANVQENRARVAETLAPCPPAYSAFPRITLRLP